MGNTGATFVRFGYGIPFALFYWLVLYNLSGKSLPVIDPLPFYFWASIGAVAQIAATFLLLYLFSFRNFVVGSAYSRTEPAQTAIFALLLFGETISIGAIIAIGVSIIGVMLISVAHSQITLRSVLFSAFTRTAAIGLASGTLFGLASVGYRAAVLSVKHDFFMMKSATTLCFAIVLQAGLMLAWMALRDRDELVRVIRAWKVGLMAGFFGATASFGWFSAFALQKAALVKVVAQIEMIFTYCASVFYFREKVTPLEIAGCAFITLGIILLVLLN